MLFRRRNYFTESPTILANYQDTPQQTEERSPASSPTGLTILSYQTKSVYRLAITGINGHHDDSGGRRFNLQSMIVQRTPEHIGQVPESFTVSIIYLTTVMLKAIGLFTNNLRSVRPSSYSVCWETVRAVKFGTFIESNDNIKNQLQIYTL